MKLKLDSGEVALETRVISSGERLWCIARAQYQNGNYQQKTLDRFVTYVCDINYLMGVDVSVLHPGDVIYLPVSD